MKRRWLLPGFAAVMVGGLIGCQEQTPTGLEEDLLPLDPRTVQVEFGWDEFASNLRTFGGFGSPADLGSPILANAFGGTLEARGLVGVPGIVLQAQVVDSTGATVTDSVITLIGGRLVLRLDTLASVQAGPVEVSAGAVFEEWDRRSATWTEAVDTVGERRLWDEQGAGPVEPLGTGVWDPEQSDSMVIALDSAAVVRFDTSGTAVGVRLDVLTEGARLQLRSFDFPVDARPSTNPDTVVETDGLVSGMTFVYDPPPEPPAGPRVGGAPAWRTVLEMDIPGQVNGPPELCEAVGCPFVLDADRINVASLVLTSRASELAFQPLDTVLVDARPVLAPERLPKSPLGGSFLRSGFPIDGSFFGVSPGREVTLPITGFVRDLLRGETSSGDEPPRTLALLSSPEPRSLAYLSFEPPGAEDEPKLRIILTGADTVQIR